MEIKNLSKSIDNVKILEDINLSIPKGIIYGIVGRNGSGKTTLFRSLASHYLLDEGEIIINQQNINEFPHLKNDLFYLDIQYQPLEGMRLKTIDNYFSLIYPLFDSDRFWSLIEEYKIADQQFQKFSKGEQCLIIVILALCTDCSYIILDEPLDGLDVLVRKQVVDLMIDTISDQERSIILASHNLHEMEKLADQVAILNNKTISTILDLTTVKMSIHKIQVAFKDSNLPQFVREAAESIISEGRVTTIIFDNYSEALKQRIIAEEPIFIEDLPLSLEDILVSKFSKEKLKGDK